VLILDIGNLLSPCRFASSSLGVARTIQVDIGVSWLLRLGRGYLSNISPMSKPSSALTQAVEKLLFHVGRHPSHFTDPFDLRFPVTLENILCPTRQALVPVLDIPFTLKLGLTTS
jgi:hypothetical protein